MDELLARRLHTQRLSRTPYADPAEVVGWLGAVQSQDYGGAAWAVAQRTTGVRLPDVERAFDDGRILRTHVLRPTWHFVTPADIRWILALTAPRVRMSLRYWDRQLGVDAALLTQSYRALEDILRDGAAFTRAEILDGLLHAGIPAAPDRMAHLLMHAELEALICSGPRRGKQFTYALLAERAPQARTLSHDDALAELTRRYFTGHGPATVQDFVWWSGLTTADARTGLDMLAGDLVEDVIGGQTMWFADAAAPEASPTPTAHLLPNYDEYIVGYTDRSAIFDDAHAGHLDARGNVLFQNTVLLDGQVVGIWKRTLKKRSVTLDTTLFDALRDDHTPALNRAIAQFGAFLDLPVEML